MYKLKKKNKANDFAPSKRIKSHLSRDDDEVETRGNIAPDLIVIDQAF